MTRRKSDSSARIIPSPRLWTKISPSSIAAIAPRSNQSRARLTTSSSMDRKSVADRFVSIALRSSRRYFAARDRRSGPEREVWIPARRPPIRRSAARGIGAGARPAHHDPSRYSQHPRCHRVSQDAKRRRSDVRRPAPIDPKQLREANIRVVEPPKAPPPPEEHNVVHKDIGRVN